MVMTIANGTIGCVANGRHWRSNGANNWRHWRQWLHWRKVQTHMTLLPVGLWVPIVSSHQTFQANPCDLNGFGVTYVNIRSYLRIDDNTSLKG